MLGGATQYVTLYADMHLRDSGKLSGFQRGSGSRHCLERHNSRVRFAHRRERFINRCCGS